MPFKDKLVLFFLLGLLHCSDVSGWRRYRTTHSTVSTSTPPLTTVKNGCMHNGILYPPHSSFGEGYDPSSNWCFGYFCDANGQFIAWDNFNCRTTSTFPTTLRVTTSSTSDKRQQLRNFLQMLINKSVKTMQNTTFCKEYPGRLIRNRL